jgi:hypothetical protein
MAKAGDEKGVPGAHWGMFEQLYGGDSGTYLLLMSHKNLDEIDKALRKTNNSRLPWVKTA